MPLAAAIPAIVGAVGGASSAAIIGSAAIGAGASIYSASQAKKASSKALAAQNAAAQQQLQLQREQRDLATSLNQPYMSGSYAAFDALLKRSGLAPRQPASTQPPQPAQPYGAQPRPPAGAQPGGYNPAQPPQSLPPPTSQPFYQTRGYGGTTAPPGYYFGPMDDLLPIPGGGASGGGQPPPAGAPSQPQYDPSQVAVDTFDPGRTASAPASAPGAPPQGGGADWQGYLAANPDVAAQAAREGRDPTEYAQQHYQVFGQSEGRDLPTLADQAQPAQPEQPQAPEAPDPRFNLMSAERPDPGPMPTFQRGPDMSAPSFSWNPADILNDQGYKFELGETIGAVNAGSAARGMLRSGDAAKALQDRASGLAHRFTNDYFDRAMRGYSANTDAYRFAQNRADNIYQDDRAFNMGQWQYGTERGDRNFNTDRTYQTNRWDTDTGNLLDLTNIGLRAAGNITGAGQNYANNASNVFGSQANAQADAANQRAAANQQLAGSLAGAAGNIFSAWGGGIRSAPAPTTVGQAWNNSFGGGWQTAANPTFVNTPSSIRF